VRLASPAVFVPGSRGVASAYELTAFIGFDVVGRLVGRVTTNVAIANANVHIAMTTNGGESASATIVVRPNDRMIAVTAMILARSSRARFRRSSGC